MHRRVSYLVFLAMTHGCQAEDQITIAALQENVGRGKRLVLALKDGNFIEGKLGKVNLANAEIVLRGKPTRAAKCAAVRAVTFYPNPPSESFERTLVGGTITLGTLAAGVIVGQHKSVSAAVLIAGASPFVGYFSSRKLMPHRAHTMKLRCPGDDTVTLPPAK